MIRSLSQISHLTFFLVISVFTVFEMIGNAVLEHRLVLDPLWTVLFVIGLVFFIVVRVIRKKTRLLHVRGR